MGQLRAAAVLPFGSNLSPLEVRLPDEYELARSSCPAHLPDRFTYLWTELHPAALTDCVGTMNATEHALKMSDHATNDFICWPPFTCRLSLPSNYDFMFVRCATHPKSICD